MPTSGEDLDFAETEMLPARQLDEEVPSGQGIWIAGNAGCRTQSGMSLIERARRTLIYHRGGGRPRGLVRESNSEVREPLS